MFAGTVGGGDLLYMPYNAVVAERTQTMVIGLRMGIIIMAPEADQNITMALVKRLESLVKIPEDANECLKKRCEAELKVSQGLHTFVFQSLPSAAPQAQNQAQAAQAQGSEAKSAPDGAEKPAAPGVGPS